jgi:hypothetical protein
MLFRLFRGRYPVTSLRAKVCVCMCVYDVALSVMLQVDCPTLNIYSNPTWESLVLTSLAQLYVI